MRLIHPVLIATLLSVASATKYEFDFTFCKITYDSFSHNYEIGTECGNVMKKKGVVTIVCHGQNKGVKISLSDKSIGHPPYYQEMDKFGNFVFQENESDRYNQAKFSADLNNGEFSLCHIEVATKIKEIK